VPFGADEVAEAADLVGRYAELRIGLAEASVVVIAAAYAGRRHGDDSEGMA
jgi:hypothetical protein